jgi:esterase/lipase
MAKQFGVPVYAVDLRNHGTSTEHVEGMSYRDMALDLLAFVKEHNLEKIALVGHSMGGKAVMAFALSPELKSGTLEYLISVDMSPARGPLSKEFEEYIEAMLAIEKKGCRTRGEADELLKETEPVSEGGPMHIRCVCSD